MKILIQCVECDSEYTVDYDISCVSDEPQFCMFCNESIEPELIEEDLED